MNTARNSTTRTPLERAAVTSALRSTGGAWSATPEFDRFSRTELHKKLDQVRDVVLGETDAVPADVQQAYEQSQHFIDSSFDFYEGKKDLGGQIARAFVVPMRSDRRDDSYASESLPFYPLLDPHRFGVTSEIRMRTMYGVPPTILDTYCHSAESTERGVLVLSPLYVDMAPDLWPEAHNVEQANKLAAVVGNVLRETVEFVHRRLGADYIGLGATLPSPMLTNFGRNLRGIDGMEALVTTTGHGGTVHMIGRTVAEVLQRSSVDSGGRIGILGAAGSIGWSTTQVLHQMLPDHRLNVFDKRDQRMQELLRGQSDLDGVTVGNSAAQILADNKVIVSAITERIDLDDEPYRNLDLQGVVWVDDSQPGSVDRNQLEARGGKVVWVAGKDISANRFMTRDGYYTGGAGYGYGDTSGLFGPTTEFACGLEAAVVAASQIPGNAVTGPVHYEDALRIGRLFDEYGVEIAEFQSFGRPVVID